MDGDEDAAPIGRDRVGSAHRGSNPDVAVTKAGRWRDRAAATHRAADVCAVAATVGDDPA